MLGQQEKYIAKLQERNPYRFVEKALGEAREKLERMRGTVKTLETLSDVRILN